MALKLGSPKAAWNLDLTKEEGLSLAHTPRILLLYSTSSLLLVVLLHFKYSASRQESNFFNFHFFVVKQASLCLIASTDIRENTLSLFCMISIPYIANGEAIQIQSVFEQFFTNPGRK